ncbi:hypothetical protein QBC47DRAFT_403347 [Echria macrotheca]|uniref:Nephrocystin 3-like N-terminal domain-containing protein n=1 Tax=Echria macrotheca TaxID=438768 RepID=A0AAJ0BBZ2_9PEZI|nr:hypothetical protein QBC47DRAFT_403347 [Echria macrotheca]
MSKLKVLYKAKSPRPIEVDIIAIDGLNPEPQGAEQGNSGYPLINWLLEERILSSTRSSTLPRHLPARISKYTWEANKFVDDSDSWFDTEATIFLKKIRGMRQRTSTTKLPIIFVASCFGGLLLAKALVLAYGWHSSIAQRNTLDLTKGIIFLSTPFRAPIGIPAAQYRLIVKSLLGIKTTSDSLLRVFEVKPDDGDKLTNAFAEVASHRDIDISFFYASEKSGISNGARILWSDCRPAAEMALNMFGPVREAVLVSEYSACLGEERWPKLQLKVRHSQLTKFWEQQDEGFRPVSTLIMAMIDKHVPRPDPMDSLRTRLRLIVESLRFQDVNARFETIGAADEEAFAWLLPKNNRAVVPPSMADHARRLRDWLQPEQEANNVFWISGKPGSGKSTFMKVLVHCLGEWTPFIEDNGAILLHHFFFLLGQPTQRSRKGMLCTLLYQLLDHLLREGALDMVDQVLRGMPSPKPLQFHDWTEHDVENLLCEGLSLIGCRRRIYACIDALDEFDATKFGLDSILNLVTKLREIPGMRMIISSRPEKELQRYFEHVPGIPIQDVTATEIHSYAFDKLSPMLENKAELASTLANRMVSKAEGVFLWVTLVVTALLSDIEAGVTPEALQKALDSFPEDMAQLYQSIWTRQNHDNEKDRQEAAMYLRLLITADERFKNTPGLCFRYWLWQTDESDIPDEVIQDDSKRSTYRSELASGATKSKVWCY